MPLHHTFTPFFNFLDCPTSGRINQNLLLPHFKKEGEGGVRTMYIEDKYTHVLKSFPRLDIENGECMGHVQKRLGTWILRLCTKTRTQNYQTEKPYG